MIYWYTGQPGHGKTLHAIERVIELKKQADAKHAEDPSRHPYRELYICNVREMQFAKIGAVELTPEEFKTWADSAEYLDKLGDLEARKRSLSKERYSELRGELESEHCATMEINARFVNAIVLIDEAYEHGIFPKRSPTAALPRHVERMAKHRQYGMDFVCVCQSPDKQCDSFLQDLIERHVHVRRRFGTKFVHLREFDRFERSPEKGHPLVVRRTLLPKKVFGLYKSTELDTTERKIPWYYIAFIVGLPLGLWFFYYTFGSIGDRVAPKQVVPSALAQSGESSPGGAAVAAEVVKAPMDAREFISKFLPRVPSQPWSAPAYDDLAVSSEPPRVFCMASQAGQLDLGIEAGGSCTCLTEQGTRYRMPEATCRQIARNGQYEPYLDERGERTNDAQQYTTQTLEDIASRERPASIIEGDISNAGSPANVVAAPSPHF